MKNQIKFNLNKKDLTGQKNLKSKSKITKENMKNFYSIVTIFLTVITSLFLSIKNTSAANYPLEIINIKPAGTGEPAISEHNRIFSAYPGIEYNIRPAVLGGEYPFSFKLENAPAGMIINATTGEISWPVPQESSGVIKLTAEDSEGSVVSTTWEVALTTNGFIFVDSNYSGIETGAINQPYSSIENMLNANAPVTDIVYFKSGSYSLPIFLPAYHLGQGCNLFPGIGGRPHIWIGHPGHTVTIDMQDHYLEFLANAGQASQYYFDSLIFTNMTDFGIRNDSSNNYLTVRRCDFGGITNSTPDYNRNQGIIHTIRELLGHYVVIQDNKFHDFHNTAAIGNTYHLTKILIEDNEIYNQTLDVLGFSNAFGLKEAVSYAFIRHNKAYNFSGGSIMANAYNDVHDVEFSFNYFDALATDDRLNYMGTSTNIHWHRNTLRIGLIFQEIVDASDGPFYLSNNVIINDNSTSYTDIDHISYHYTCDMSGATPFATTRVIQNNNLKGFIGDNIIDQNGNLTQDYSSYLGTHGWQISNEIIRADVDQQNGITSTDAMLTLRNSLGLDMSSTAWQTSDTTGDVDCNNITNSTDAMLILRYSLGLDMSGTAWCE